jgi:hypothetical protein
MISLLNRIFLEHWQRKIIALITAVLVWIVVDRSITVSKTFSNVAVRVINLPKEYTIKGMQPNGFLSQHITLVLTGQRSILQPLSAQEIEVVLNAEGKTTDWAPKISRYDLTTTNPDINLSRDVSKVEHGPFKLDVMRMQTAKISILIAKPDGTPPAGYQYTGVFPKKLWATVQATEKELSTLKERGLHIEFDLNKISKKELDEIEAHHVQKKEIILYTIPNSWKKVRLPFAPYSQVEIDDERAQNLKITFLRTHLIPLEKHLPLSIYFGNLDTTKYNPQTIQLKGNEYVVEKNGVYFLKESLFAKNVSKRFLDVIKNNLQVVINIEEDEEGSPILKWNFNVVNPKHLEQMFYKKILLEEFDHEKNILEDEGQKQLFRYQFYNFLRHFEIYTAPNCLLDLDLKLENNEVVIAPKNLNEKNL